MGLVLAVPSGVCLRRAAAGLVAQALAVLLGGIAGIYVGFGVSAGRAKPLIVEAVAAVAFWCVGVAGLHWAPQWLAVALLVHAGWDALHHLGRVGAPVPRWYPVFCATYDLVLGAWLLVTAAP